MGRPNEFKDFEKQSEKTFSQLWLEKLDQHFHIKKEITGTHLSGQKMRIDAIISPKETRDWKNKQIAFGIEFKSPSNIDRLNDQTCLMKQCVDYSYTDFPEYGFIPILFCPGFTLDESYSDEKSLTAIKHFLNTFNVGELKETYRGLSIIFAEHHFIWANGKVNEGKRWTLQKTFGSKK